MASCDRRLHSQLSDPLPDVGEYRAVGFVRSGDLPDIEEVIDHWPEKG